MAWTWRYQTAAGEQVRGLDAELAGESFPSQSDAESWLGETWRELVEKGIDQVTLLEGDREVYGPMSLHGPA